LSSAWLCAANVTAAELAHAARHEPEVGTIPSKPNQG